ncbi:MAG: hypothetical protein JWM19_983 [Actinomycetia bacterium]|nr:hypothetical protein [Actinomycetes bacterium]
MTLRRIWPGNPAPSGTTAGAAAAGTLGTEFAVSSACNLVNVWWYSPAGAAALPQACGIWDIASQSLVTEDASPQWLDPGGAIAVPGDGWVYCDFTGAAVTLAAGLNYAVAAWQDSAAAWYVTTAGYWTSGAGASGTADGALSAPSNSGAVNGQGCLSSGGTWQSPGTSGAGAAYYIDVEVQEAAMPGGITAIGSEYQAEGASTLDVVPSAAENALVVCLTATAAPSGLALSGGGVTRWTYASSFLDTSNNCYVDIWLGVITAAGSATITVAGLDSAGMSIWCREFSESAGGYAWSAGAVSSAPASSGAPTGSGLDITYPPLSAAGAGNSLYIGNCFSVYGDMAAGTDGGYAYDEVSTAPRQVAWNPAFSGGSPGATQTNTGVYDAVAAVIVSAPASGGPPPGGMLLSMGI